jgi:hypothetical protein
MFESVTRVHARSLATQFSLQIAPSERPRMRRKASRVSFLMCPFCVRAASSHLTTPPAPPRPHVQRGIERVARAVQRHVQPTRMSAVATSLPARASVLPVAPGFHGRERFIGRYGAASLLSPIRDPVLAACANAGSSRAHSPSAVASRGGERRTSRRSGPSAPVRSAHARTPRSRSSRRRRAA